LKNFSELTEQEILSLAISLEEEHARIYRAYAQGLSPDFQATANVFLGLAAEEDEHRRMLIDRHSARFGETIPYIRRGDVKGLAAIKPIWLVRPLGVEAVRRQAEDIERESQRFYERAAARAADAGTRKLLGDLAAAEGRHSAAALALQAEFVTPQAAQSEKDSEARRFLLQVVQPALVGLMDGSVSTLAPLFAAAFATHDTWATFLIGLAASVGAGISMGFAEALSDDGELTGRGHPWARGGITGLATMIGGVGHTLPYLIPDFNLATAIAIAIVLTELWVIAWIRARYMETKFLRAAFEVVVGGLIVFAAGILIGNA